MRESRGKYSQSPLFCTPYSSYSALSLKMCFLLCCLIKLWEFKAMWMSSIEQCLNKHWYSFPLLSPSPTGLSEFCKMPSLHWRKLGHREEMPTRPGNDRPMPEVQGRDSEQSAQGILSRTWPWQFLSHVSFMTMVVWYYSLCLWCLQNKMFLITKQPWFMWEFHQITSGYV